MKLSEGVKQSGGSSGVINKVSWSMSNLQLQSTDGGRGAAALGPGRVDLCLDLEETLCKAPVTS